eukprot:gene7885-1098_t
MQSPSFQARDIRFVDPSCKRFIQPVSLGPRPRKSARPVPRHVSNSTPMLSAPLTIRRPSKHQQQKQQHQWLQCVQPRLTQLPRLPHVARSPSSTGYRPCRGSRASIIARGLEESSEQFSDSSEASSSKPTSLSEAANLVTQLLTSISDSTNPDRLDSFLLLIPDEMLDRVIELKREENGGLSFGDVLALVHSESGMEDPGLSLDSWAERLCLLSAPSSTQCLSSLRVAPDRSVHRFLVTSGAEVAILTFTMVLQESLQAQ